MPYFYIMNQIFIMLKRANEVMVHLIGWICVLSIDLGYNNVGYIETNL